MATQIGANDSGRGDKLYGCGGGALLKGFSDFQREETSLPIIIAENQLSCVMPGVGKVLDNEYILEKVKMR